MGLIPENDRFTRWLERAVCTDQFRDIVQSFSSSFSFSISFVTKSGSFIDCIESPSFPCMDVRKVSVTDGICIDSLGSGARSSIISGKAMMFRCLCGAGNLAVPIIIEGVSEGCILCGQFLFRRYKVEEWEYILQGKYPDRDNSGVLAAQLTECPVVDGPLVGKILERLSLMASHIGKMYQRDVLETQNLLKDRARKIDDVAFENSLKVLQARDLRSQLNPHFLFNTLNAISQLAMLEGAEQTQELTYQFSEYLRYVLRKQSRQEVVPLSMEIDCIKRYLEIYRIRFRERLKYDISIAPGAGKAGIPFMLLQPLVENAILHGIEPSLYPGAVAIGAVLVGTFVLIDITDNGMGCDPDMISGGIGLQNVRERMHLHFGLSADLEIRSKPGEGTSVVIRIPFEEA